MASVELISIGNELLSGFTTNTNAAWLGREMANRGHTVKWGTVIADEKVELIDAFSRAGQRADIVLVTGGLGPTHDDITKNVVSEYFSLPLKMNAKALNNVKEFFKRRGRELNDLGRQQGLIPEGADVLSNRVGTASGIGIQKNSTIFIFMPGVPSEMKNIMNNDGFIFVQNHFHGKPMKIVNLKMVGIYESRLSELLEDIIRDAPNSLSFAFLPKLGQVTLRVSAAHEFKNSVADIVSEIKKRTVKYLFSDNEENLEQVIGQLLIQRTKTLSVAESCTGGLVSHMLTNIPGSTGYVFYNAVTYSNEAKEKYLLVDHDTLVNFGAVSEETAKEMAEGIRNQEGTDYGLAITGIAGPDGGTEEKPVGLVYIALSQIDGPTLVSQYQFGSDRQGNKLLSATAALNILRRVLLFGDY